MNLFEYLSCFGNISLYLNFSEVNISTFQVNVDNFNTVISNLPEGREILSVTV
jgi:hypothetical protein